MMHASTVCCIWAFTNCCSVCDTKSDIVILFFFNIEQIRSLYTLLLSRPLELGGNVLQHSSNVPTHGLINKKNRDHNERVGRPVVCCCAFPRTWKSTINGWSSEALELTVFHGHQLFQEVQMRIHAQFLKKIWKREKTFASCEHY